MTSRHSESSDHVPETDYALRTAQQWFAEHVTLDGKPYTLDIDQARAAIDNHHNTLVTARAGSGKTRVIVAKVAYLVAQCHYTLDEIAVFMFNRTAAAEVNQRVKDVKIDDRPLVAPGSSVHVASTFHKYALDLVKLTGECPQILNEADHQTIIRQALDKSLQTLQRRTNPNEFRELLNIVSGFVTRAGQKYPGFDGLTKLKQDVTDYCHQAQDSQYIFYHRLSYMVYERYLAAIQPPRTDFNLLMSHATDLLLQPQFQSTFQHITRLKYLMIDEYQDFSYLFFALTSAIRKLAPQAHLFVVGDDWQAINRFAGSDVDYFLQFSKHFPNDSINIPLATNYRSAQRIVERANHYMLSNYDPQALPAQAFSCERGKIIFCHPEKQRFDATDITEDRLGDARFQLALAKAAHISPQQIPVAAARLLKQVYKLVKRHRHSDIMLLHRHNFTTFEHVSLEVLHQALGYILATEQVMSTTDFERQIRSMTMHKSKGLESTIVILLEVDREVVNSHHPHATLFSLFGDTLAAELADQKRLLYVALTRAKRRLYILSHEQKPII